jgi:hypothetical protein
MSIVCGIEINGSEAILVTLEGTRQEHEIIGTKFKRIKINDEKNQNDIHSFHQTISDYFATNRIQEIGIKARMTKGEYAGGPISFKIEGIIQTLEVPVKLIYPISINATLKKEPINLEELNLNKYQYEAYKVAYHMLGA